ncbi:MAG TPA: YggT family protein [Gammaproteobacteria bacterium]|nr:YggT family protein [Gammaproteobacteria bacterium]
MQAALLFLVRALSDLYVLAFVMRFIFQLIRMSYDNPLAQAVVQITNPLVVPARRMLPSIRGIDLPTLIVIVALECVATLLLLTILHFVPTVPQFVFFVLLRLVALTIWFYIFTLILYVAVSWLAGGTYHPMMSVLSEIVTPILRPVRRVLPPMSGLDLSPMLVTIALIALSIALRTPF